MQMIAFTGLKGSGKDTAAQVAVEMGYEHVKFADLLKAMLTTMLHYQGVPPEMAARYVEGDRKEQVTSWFNGRTARHAMQTLGTEWGREQMGDDVWVNATRERCLMHEKVVISDVRFPNEAAMVAEMGGRLFRIDRGLPPSDLHVSEAHIPHLPVTAVIANTDATADAFKHRVWYIVFAEHLAD